MNVGSDNLHERQELHLGWRLEELHTTADREWAASGTVTPVIHGTCVRGVNVSKATEGRDNAY